MSFSMQPDQILNRAVTRIIQPYYKRLSEHSIIDFHALVKTHFFDLMKQGNTITEGDIESYAEEAFQNRSWRGTNPSKLEWHASRRWDSLENIFANIRDWVQFREHIECLRNDREAHNVARYGGCYE